MERSVFYVWNVLKIVQRMHFEKFQSSKSYKKHTTLRLKAFQLGAFLCYFRV